MLHRGIKFVHAFVLAFSAVLAFLLLRSPDEDWVLGHSAVVWVTDVALVLRLFGASASGASVFGGFGSSSGADPNFFGRVRVRRGYGGRGSHGPAGSAGPFAQSLPAALRRHAPDDAP